MTTIPIKLEMCKMCVFPTPVAPWTLPHNWALYTPTCHTGSHCRWYYHPLSPVTLCLAAVAGLLSQCVCLTSAEGLCWVLPMTLLTGSKSYVFVELVNIKQLLCWPDIDPTVVCSSKKCAHWRHSLQNTLILPVFLSCLFSSLPWPFSCYTHKSVESKIYCQQTHSHTPEIVQYPQKLTCLVFIHLMV